MAIRHFAPKATLLLSSLAALAGCVPVTGRTAPSSGARYVALGSSFAAGPGLAPAIVGKIDRCARSSVNYAHLMATRRNLTLVDVSCSGATTAHILGGWAELPPQVEAVSGDTRLVTITIGGNDVGYIGGLMSASRCATSGTGCKPGEPPGGEAWEADERAMRAIVDAIRRRAPNARIVFVDYVTVIPRRGTCAILGLNDAQAAAGRAIADRLAALTARVAASEGCSLLPASTLSHGHDACSRKPWVNGAAPSSGVPFHPNAEGMHAIASAMDRQLTR